MKLDNCYVLGSENSNPLCTGEKIRPLRRISNLENARNYNKLQGIPLTGEKK